MANEHYPNVNQEEINPADLFREEEPRNDFIDTGVGFMAAFGLFFLMGIIATVIEFWDRIMAAFGS